MLAHVLAINVMDSAGIRVDEIYAFFLCDRRADSDVDTERYRSVTDGFLKKALGGDFNED